MTYKYLLILIIFVVSSNGFQQAHTEQGVMAYYEQYSFKPIIHVYFNHHFKNSTKFQLFQTTLNQLYTDHQDYLEILFTDCDQDKEKKLQVCEKMRKTKDNRQITGTAPSSDFKRIGNFIIQSPPMTQTINEHVQDVYHYHELKTLIAGILPNFYKQINNIEQYEDFLNPRYSPKLIVFAQDQQQIPIVMKYIAVAFFLKFDLAFVSDLTEDIVSQFKIKKNQPSFVIIKYNFNESKHEYFYYSGSELTQPNYQKIKQFAAQYALSQPRNDLLFHKISMETTSEIVTIQTQGQLEEFKQRATGWVIIISSSGQVSPKLYNLYKKYGRYLSYVNYVREPHDLAQIYNPTLKTTYFMDSDDLQFNSLDFQDFRSNMTVWLSKDVIVVGVSSEYAHICGLAEKTFFRQNVKCLIISPDGKSQLQSFMKIQFDIGFIARAEYNKKKSDTKETKGMKIMKDDFEQIYKDLDYSVRVKLKQQLDNYLENPVSQIKQNLPLSQICFHPFKKCLFLVTSLSKQDRTLQQYLKQTAFDYMNNFIIYEVDMDSNPEFVEAIGGVKDKKADIVVYMQNTQEYVKLNKKITKNLMTQFFRANLKNDKRLKKTKSQKLGDIVIKSFNKVLRKKQSKKHYEEQEEL